MKRYPGPGTPEKGRRREKKKRRRERVFSVPGGPCQAVAMARHVHTKYSKRGRRRRRKEEGREGREEKKRKRREEKKGVGGYRGNWERGVSCTLFITS
jgi:hypothetical protein